MKNISHLFFVVFFAIIIAVGLALNIIGGESSYESTIPEYSVWALFFLSVAILLSEKYKKIYWYFIFAGLFLLVTVMLQLLVFIETQELWYKTFRAFVIPFSIYIYTTMFLSHHWKLLKRYRQKEHNKSLNRIGAKNAPPG